MGCLSCCRKFVLATLVLSASSLWALDVQQPAPAPQSPAAQAGIATIRVRSNIVVVDVVVTDSKQKPIHGLKASDFSITESGRPQAIRSFEEYTSLSDADAAKFVPPPKLPAGLFTNQPAVPSDGPVTVLLLDYLNTPLNAQPFARKQLLDFLDKSPKGMRIAIFGMNGNGLTMLQGCTSDPEVLKAALRSKKGTPQVSDILTDPVNGGPQGNTTLQDNFVSDALDAAQQLANIQRFQAFETSFEQDIRMKSTMNSLGLLARYLMGIPGRKNLIWYSGSFPLSIEPDTTLQDAFDSVVRNDDEVRTMDNLLMRAQVAIYPVDARGLFTDPGQSVTANIGEGTAFSAANVSASGATGQMSFMMQTAQEHETMEKMAEDTGGHAYINTNGLSQAIQSAVETGSNYYTLVYSPNNLQWDGRFRSIKIKVDQPGVKLTYRNGYYADDPNDRNRNIAGSAAVALVRPPTMTTAMLYGAPQPTEILFKSRIRPLASPPENTLVTGNKPNPDPKVNVTGPYKGFGIDIVPDPRSISCPQGDDEVMHCAIEAATYVYDKDGTLLIANNWHAQYTLSPANYKALLQHGMAIHQAISVPVKGDYYLRTAVHDLNSDRVGAIQVPVAMVKNLPPLQAPPTPAASPADPAKAPQGAPNGPASSSPESKSDPGTAAVAPH